MTQHAPPITSILSDLGLVARDLSLVTIGITGPGVPGTNTIATYETLPGPDELPATLKATLGIVVSPLDFMTRRRAEQLLSRLRDVHCDRVLLVDARGSWKAEELRPLGYLEAGQPEPGFSCYLYDPDAFHEPREWNNPSDWANPENFRKYRW